MKSRIDFIDIVSTVGCRGLLSLTLALTTSLASQAQYDPSYSAPSTLHGKTVMMPRGTTFEGRLDSTIGSGKSRQGEKFTISMTSPVLANGVDVLIPAGSQVLGEVVEAIPSGHVQKTKGYVKPDGKLRVQLSGLRTPDGITYPLVASLAGELLVQGGHATQRNPNLGGGVGYVGSSASFEAVAPGMADRARRTGQGAKVMTKDQIMRDPIYGADSNDRTNNQPLKIRSLVKKGRELVIYNGSPVTIKLDAPFKIGITQAAGAEATLAPVGQIEETSARRFSKDAPILEHEHNQGSVDNPLPGILPDVPHSNNISPPQSVTPNPQRQNPAGGDF